MTDQDAIKVSLDWTRVSEAEMRSRVTYFYERMCQRRSVRQFSTEPFPLDVLDQAIAAACRAPSGANQQPWSFVVVTNPELKAKIRAAAEAEERQNWGVRMPQEWKRALRPLGVSVEKPYLTEAPALVVVFVQSWRLVQREPGDEVEREKHYFADESVSIAVGFLLAALQVAGLATLVHTPSPMTFLKTLLNRPPGERAMFLIPVGYPKDNAQVPVLQRRSLDEVCIRFS